jgi:hypothetical protein
MLIIVELILTVFAWRKGWRWKALIPVACTISLGLFAGTAIGLSGGQLSGATNVLFFFGDLASTAILIVLCVKKPKSLELVPAKN